MRRDRPTLARAALRAVGRALSRAFARAAERAAALGPAAGEDRSLLRDIRAAVVVHGPDTAIVTSNPMAQELLGLTEDQLLGKCAVDPEWHFLRQDGAIMPVNEYPVSQVFATRKPLRDFVAGVRRPDKGDDVWALVNADPVAGEDGEIARVIVTFVDITERKQAEAALRRSEERFRRTLDGMLEGCALIGFDWRYLYLNEAAARHVHSRRDRLIGRTVLETFPGMERSEIFARFRECMVERVSRHFEASQHFPDGTTSWVELSVRPAEEGIFALSIDITDRKRAEEERARSHRELRAISLCNQTLLRATNEQSLLNDICRIVCDEAGYRMAWVGYPERDEAKAVRPVAWAGVEGGRLADAQISWADTERGRGACGTALREGVSCCIQDFALDPRGAPWRERVLWRGCRSCIALPLKDEGESTFGAFCIYSTEPDAFTSEEIHLLEELAGNLAFGLCVLRARAEHRWSEEELRISEGRYRRAQAVGHVGNWEYNLQTAKFWGSDEAKRVYGFDPDASDLSTDDVESCIPERERVHQALVDLIEAGKPYNLEFEIHPRDSDKPKIISSVAELKRDDRGNPLLVVGVIQDITERKRAEEQIRKFSQELEGRVAERTAQLQLANQELEGFAYSVSHDLRAPLRHIDGFLGLLERRTAATLDRQSAHYMATIADAAKRMGLLIDDLLSFSRMGRNELSRKPIDLNDLVREVVRELEPEARGRAVEWRLGDLPAVRGDTAMLRIVLVNLLSNALKFTRSRARAEIEVGGAPGKDGEIVVHVRDNGVGFDPRYVDKLFGVFQRLHRADEFEGTGIGLANVRRIVNRHGGRTWAEGELGRGATFFFSLPGALGGP